MPQTYNQFWAHLVVEELVRQGVDTFCLASGARCTPLVLAVAQHDKATAVVHFDERGCGFHAVGQARATGRPVAVITTSGTAVANLMPAVVEASQEGVPMVLLTADRPPELRDAGANQAIDQIKFFGSMARWFFDVPCPTRDISPSFLLTTVAHAVHRATGPDPGPVHLNFMFRDPLAPEFTGEDLSPSLKVVSEYLEGRDPYTHRPPAPALPEPSGVKALAATLAASSMGLVVVGGLRSPAEREAVGSLLRRLGWPVLTDVTSGLRDAEQVPLLVRHAEGVVRSVGFVAGHRPDTVLHVGDRMVSKHVERFLHSADRFVRISSSPRRLDSYHHVDAWLEGDLALACRQLEQALPALHSAEWGQEWSAAGVRAADVVEGFARDAAALSEPWLARALWQDVPADHALVIGNSMPVRDLDFMAYVGKGPCRVGANRGASGIDGTVATAVGFARGCGRPTTVVLGDLALLHDLNSLHLVKQSPQPLTVVVVNNHGGGIFHFLPMVRYSEVFEKFWGTPHDCGFASAAEMFGLAYHRPETPAAFLDACSKAWSSGHSSVIEVVTDRSSNHELHEEILAAVRAAVDEPLAAES